MKLLPRGSAVCNRDGEYMPAINRGNDSRRVDVRVDDVDGEVAQAAERAEVPAEVRVPARDRGAAGRVVGRVPGRLREGAGAVGRGAVVVHVDDGDWRCGLALGGQ